MRTADHHHKSHSARLLISLVVGLVMTFASIVFFYPYGDFRMAGAPLRFLTMSERMTIGSFADNISINWKLLLLNWIFFASLIWTILFVFSLASLSAKRNIFLAVTAGTVISTLTATVYQPARGTKYQQRALEVRGIPFAFLLVGGEHSLTKNEFQFRYSIDFLGLSADVLIWSCVAAVPLAIRTRNRRAKRVTNAGGHHE